MKYDVIMPYYRRAAQLDATLGTYACLYAARNDYMVTIAVDAKIDEGSADMRELDDVMARYDGRVPLMRIRVGTVDCYNPCLAFNQTVWATRFPFIILTNPECAHTSDILGAFDAVPQQESTYVTCACCRAIDWSTSFAKISEFTYKRVSWVHPPTGLPRALHFCACISRDNYRRVGGFDENFRHGVAWEDNDFMCAITDARIPFIQRDDLVVAHLEHQPPKEYVPDFDRRHAANLAYYLSKGRKP